MERTGFIRALWGSCCGTAIFFRLRHQSWLRTIWHLLMLSILCALAITWGENRRIGPEVEHLANSFQEVFGGVEMSRNAIVPAERPAESRNLALPGGGQMFYLSDLHDGVSLSEDELQLLNYFLVWSPKFLASAMRGQDGNWRMAMQEAGSVKQQTLGQQLSSDELKRYLEGVRTPAGKWPLPGSEQVVETKVMFDMISGVITLFLLLGNFLMTFLLPWFYTGLFSAVFRFTGGRQLRVLTMREFWKIGIYAGFPVMLVGSCFPAFDLPFLSYSTVFMIGLVIYWLVIAARIERSGVQSEGGEFHE